MQTLIEQARRGKISWQVTSVAAAEGIDTELLCGRIAKGSAVIMQRGNRCTGIGKGLRTKINANIGTSTNKVCVEDEIAKACIAEQYGADTISDLSMGGDINAVRAAIMASTTLPITTVPVYQTVVENGLKEMTAEDIIANLSMQAEQGISSCVIHCVSHTMLQEFRRKKRILGVVSKGGSITSAFMLINQCENPFIEHFEQVLSICKKHDIILSLGNTARSGCIHDQRDKAQLEEIRQNVALAHRAHETGVQVIIEGTGGHSGAIGSLRMSGIRNGSQLFLSLLQGLSRLILLLGMTILPAVRARALRVRQELIISVISPLPSILGFQVRSRSKKDSSPSG